jgi:NTE family protein
MINSLRTATLPYADIIIQPDVHGIFALDIRKMKAAIRAGERAAETQLSNIINLIS